MPSIADLDALFEREFGCSDSRSEVASLYSALWAGPQTVLVVKGVGTLRIDLEAPDGPASCRMCPAFSLLLGVNQFDLLYVLHIIIRCDLRYIVTVTSNQGTCPVEFGYDISGDLDNRFRKPLGAYFLCVYSSPTFDEIVA
ncbi:hypothetical protein C8J56DRAFT_892221 [Mycena floridula]|nr:hypothetical protein C8J56DRAFT_892221 [Mycena floridula]